MQVLPWTLLAGHCTEDFKTELMFFAEVSLRKSPKRVLEGLQQEFTHINLFSNYSPCKMKAPTEVAKAG